MSTLFVSDFFGAVGHIAQIAQGKIEQDTGKTYRLEQGEIDAPYLETPEWYVLLHHRRDGEVAAGCCFTQKEAEEWANSASEPEQVFPSKAEWKSVARNPLTSVWLLITLIGSVVAVWTHTIGIAVVVLLVTALLAVLIWRKAKWVEEEEA